MNSSIYGSPAIGALILVPIIIAASAASIALKASDYSQALAKFVKHYWQTHFLHLGSIRIDSSRHKLKRSNFRSSQLQSDLWYDLDSFYSDQEIGYCGFTDKEKSDQRNHNYSTSESQVSWYPFHTDQSRWSFTKPKSPRQDLCELQNVARPSAIARRPTRLSVGDAALLARPIKAREARRWNTSGPDNTSNLDVRSRPKTNTTNYENIELNSSEDKHIQNKDAVFSDLEMTPKASQIVSRMTSADAFLKSDLHQRSSQINASRFSVREESPLLSQKKLETHKSIVSLKPPPVAPERFSSKPKKTFQLGFTGRNQQVISANSCYRNHTTVTKKKLIRSISRNRNPSATSSEQSAESNLSGTFYVDRCLNYTDSGEIQRSSYENSLVCSKIKSQYFDTLVLCPEIRILPEVTSVDISDSSLWVAIEIKGALRRPDREFDEYKRKERQDSLDSRYSRLVDIKRFGYLDSMRINIDGDNDCHISKIIGNYHGPLTINANQTHLILVKVFFSSIISSRDHQKFSSEELISELQNDLGDNSTPYLKVRLHYRHSGFYKKDLSDIHTYGINSNLTLLQTEATAVITRCNTRSVWSSYHSKNSRNISPILQLIEKNFYPGEAQDAIKQISEDRDKIPSAEFSWQDIRPSKSIDKPENALKSISFDPSLGPLRISSPSPPNSIVHLPQVYLPRELTDEVDPARKIWVEMRRTSLGSSPLNNCRTSRHREHARNERYSSSNHSLEPMTLTKRQSSKVEYERGKIMGVALRNKRSLGEETLRSIAPSIDNNQELKYRYESGARSSPSPGLGGGAGVARNWLMGLFPRS